MICVTRRLFRAGENGLAIPSSTVEVDDGSMLKLEPSLKAKPEPRADDTSAALERYALSVVLPMWMAAGSLDYFFHRRSRIEATSGTYEARLHVLGISITAAPVLAGLLLEIDAGVLAFMGAGYIGHLGMTIVDVAYADQRRRVVPLEQHLHALLELLPFTALSLLALAHRDQARALAGRGHAVARYAFRRKRRPLSTRVLALVMGTFVSVVALPYAEELLRCMRYERERAILDANAPGEHREVEHSE